MAMDLAPDTAATDATAPTIESSQTWAAVEYEAALAHLEHLQNQIDRMRTVIPELLAPLTKPYAKNEDKFLDVRRVAVRSQDQVRTFREALTSEQTQSLLVRSGESLAGNGDLGPSETVPKWGWQRP